MSLIINDRKFITLDLGPAYYENDHSNPVQILL